ncbi:MAG: hypothetical protein M1820_002643 [Bogoriella megaspora]|nr:MAG: hypothetical protein M1820_002643 [Bogoriella megaspora]
MPYKSSILVTGGTTGLGYCAAVEIARQKPDAVVIIASRSSADDAAAKINKALNQSNVQYLPLDLSVLANVHEFASKFLAASYPPLSALVLNAGIAYPGTVEYTEDGLEKTFAVNHLAHALLFYLLRPHLCSTARIVITSSNAHDPAMKTGMPDALYLDASEAARPTERTLKQPGRKRYTTSKLCNVMWMYALSRHVETTGLKYTVTALDPGMMPGTALARTASPTERFIWNRVLPHIIPVLRRTLNPNIHKPEESGAALARLAVGKDVEGITAKYFEGRKELQSSEQSYDVSKQDNLWKWTATAVAKDEFQAKSWEELCDM